MAVPRKSIDQLVLWATSWAEHGWQPHIIGRQDLLSTGAEGAAFLAKAEHAARYVLKRAPFRDIEEQVAFRALSLVQYGAAAALGGGVLTDSDVINYGLSPSEVNEAARRERLRNGGKDKMLVLEGRKCECVSAAPGAAHACRPLPTSPRMECTHTTTHERLSGTLLSAHSERGGAWADACPRVLCVTFNSGLHAGTAAAYRSMLTNWFSLIERTDERSHARPWRTLGEPMHFVSSSHALESIGTADLFGVTYDPLETVVPSRRLKGQGAAARRAWPNHAWRRAKALHFWGSGVCKWHAVFCASPLSSTRYGSCNDTQVLLSSTSVHEARGQLCRKGVTCGTSRAAIIRAIRDPLDGVREARTRRFAMCCAHEAPRSSLLDLGCSLIHNNQTASRAAQVPAHDAKEDLRAVAAAIRRCWPSSSSSSG